MKPFNWERWVGQRVDDALEEAKVLEAISVLIGAGTKGRMALGRVTAGLVRAMSLPTTDDLATLHQRLDELERRLAALEED